MITDILIMLQINDTVIAGVRTLIYEPVVNIWSHDRPVLIFLHGGGWSRMSVGGCALPV